MPYEWIEPEVFMEHSGVVVYHVYKDDSPQNGGAREYWFCLEACESMDDGGNTFDVRSLPAYGLSKQLNDTYADLFPGDALKQVIAHEIDAGFFDDWEKDDAQVQTDPVQALATVLAALRYWTANTEEDERHETMPDTFKYKEPLNDDEIEDLCQRLNHGGLNV